MTAPSYCGGAGARTRDPTRHATTRLPQLSLRGRQDQVTAGAILLGVFAAALHLEPLVFRWPGDRESRPKICPGMLPARAPGRRRRVCAHSAHRWRPWTYVRASFGEAAINAIRAMRRMPARCAVRRTSSRPAPSRAGRAGRVALRSLGLILPCRRRGSRTVGG